MKNDLLQDSKEKKGWPGKSLMSSLRFQSWLFAHLRFFHLWKVKNPQSSLEVGLVFLFGTGSLQVGIIGYFVHSLTRCFLSQWIGWERQPVRWPLMILSFQCWIPCVISSLWVWARPATCWFPREYESEGILHIIKISNHLIFKFFSCTKIHIK